MKNAVVYEEDIENAATAAVRTLGVNGRMIHRNKGMRSEWVPNAVVITKEHGRIWYGDLELDNDNEKIFALAKELGVPVGVYYDGALSWGDEKNVASLYTA